MRKRSTRTHNTVIHLHEYQASDGGEGKKEWERTNNQIWVDVCWCSVHVHSLNMGNATFSKRITQHHMNQLHATLRSNNFHNSFQLIHLQWTVFNSTIYIYRPQNIFGKFHASFYVLKKMLGVQEQIYSYNQALCSLLYNTGKSAIEHAHCVHLYFN